MENTSLASVVESLAEDTACALIVAGASYHGGSAVAAWLWTGTPSVGGPSNKATLRECLPGPESYATGNVVGHVRMASVHQYGCPCCGEMPESHTADELADCLAYAAEVR